MVIVINFSKQMVGFNLFKNLFYTLKTTGKLVFINNPQTDDALEIKVEDLKITIQNILYANHASSFCLYVLYDRSDQIIHPLKHSITSHIHQLKEHIIKPLSKDYIFDKFYYFSLDNVQRNQDWLPLDENIILATEFDSKGYLSKSINNNYSQILFSNEDFEEIDKLWKEIKRKSLLINQEELTQTISLFQEQLKSFFDSKTIPINELDSTLNWYYSKLNQIYQMILAKFDEVFSLNSTTNPSQILKSFLKNEICNFSNLDTTIIRIEFNEQNVDYNQETLRYRKQLEVLALFIYLATSDTRRIFEENKAMNRFNHWQVQTVLNEQILFKMFDAYDLKLKSELAKMGHFLTNEIEYKEFSPRNLNFLAEMKKPSLPVIPNYQIFPDKKDSSNMTHFVQVLYDSYLEGIDYANKRIIELTQKLRLQKEATSDGKTKKTSLLEFHSEIIKLQTEMTHLQERIVTYQPKETLTEDLAIKLGYDTILNEIQVLMANRIEKKHFLKTLLLMIIIFLCIYILFQSIYSSTFMKIVSLMIIIIMPIIIYILIYLKQAITLKNKITKKIDTLINYHENTINHLFIHDKEKVIYVQDIYRLIMLKKYLNECTLKMNQYQQKLNQYHYHYDKLKTHLETNRRLIELLSLKSITIESLKIDNIKEIDITSSLEKNPLYCPLSYLSLVDSIKNIAIINEEQRINIDNQLIGFVDKLIITYDKEYNHE